jgi:TP53 regulating kinase-like protein
MEDVQNSTTVKDYIAQISEEAVNEAGTADSLLMKLNPTAQEIGKVLGKLHANNIIHGDLTSSNMLVVKDGKDTPTSVLIDFGLSHVESSMEDKAVDLYVLQRALISTHANVDKLFTAILSAYIKENKKESQEVLKKFNEVRARGRKRTMVG